MPSTTVRDGSMDVCREADVSYRQLDYWIRIGLIEPIGVAMPGSGGQRRFTKRERRVIAAVGRLFDLGATERTLRHVAPMLRAMAAEEWHGQLVVSKNGVVSRYVPGVTFGEACWILNLDLVANRAA